MAAQDQIVVATAGWSIGKDVAGRIGDGASALQRYATVLGGVEVNSSFYRRHRPATWQRWRDAVPEHFRFAVKMPRRITHDGQLVDPGAELDLFAADVAELESKLGPVLVQLPPKLAFDTERADTFFRAARQRFGGRIVLEPRHLSWASAEAVAVLAAHHIDRVQADPQLPALRAAVDPTDFVYLRLHGSPRVYYSEYDAAQIAASAELLRGGGQGGWCVFDNTASGAAVRNALQLHDALTG